MPALLPPAWLRTVSAATLLALGCDAEDSPLPLEDSPAEFRCAPLEVPGIGGLQTATINGTAVVSSLGTGFDLFSNGTIQVAGAATVSGGAYSVMSTIDLFNTAIVTGLPSAGASRTGEIPNYQPLGAITFIQANHVNAAIPLTSAGNDPVTNGTELSLFGGESVTLAAGWYYFDSVSLSGASTLEFDGLSYVVIAGAMTVSGGSTITIADPEDLLFLGSGTDAIDISDGSQVTMRLYAPDAPVTISGTSTHFNGGVLGGTLQLSGTTTMEVSQDALHIWRPC